MKCPFCSKDNKDDARFCCFCGKPIQQIRLEEPAPSTPPPLQDDEKFKVVSNETEVAGKVAPILQEEEPQGESKDKSKKKSKKKRTVLKVFILIAFIAGSVLGFLTARGIISLEFLLPNSDFKWTSFSEGVSSMLLRIF